MKIKNILSSSPATESQLTEFRVNRTLKKGVKIVKVKPSYLGQHWVDLNNYHINKILEKKIKIGEIYPQKLSVHNGMDVKNNKVTFPIQITNFLTILKRMYRITEGYTPIISKNKFG